MVSLGHSELREISAEILGRNIDYYIAVLVVNYGISNTIVLEIP